jgi:hypothetical protein
VRSSFLFLSDSISLSALLSRLLLFLVVFPELVPCSGKDAEHTQPSHILDTSVLPSWLHFKTSFLQKFLIKTVFLFASLVAMIAITNSTLCQKSC